MTLPTEERPEATPEHSDTIYEVLYQGQPIGWSRLEGRDAAMGMALGAFEPLPAYQAVQAVFLLFAEAEEAHMRGEAARAKKRLTTYYQARDALQLTLQTTAGRVIPTSTIHIVDFGEEVGREVHVGILDPTFW